MQESSGSSTPAFACWMRLGRGGNHMDRVVHLYLSHRPHCMEAKPSAERHTRTYTYVYINKSRECLLNVCHEAQAQYSCTARCWELSKELRANKEYSRGIVKPNGTKQNFIMSSFYCFFFMFIFESPLHSEPAVARKATKCARLTDTDRAPQPIFSLGGGHSAGAS